MEVDLNELERLAKAATPGPWDLEPIRSEGCYGSGPNCSTGFDSYEIRADGSVLLDALNSDAALVSEDWDGGALYAWDEIGQRNLSFIAAANPVVVLELVRRLREAEGYVTALRYIAWESSGYMDAVHIAKQAIGETGALPPPPKIQPARGEG